MKIKSCVRVNPLGHLELFYVDEYKEITCFSFQEGHNTTCRHYMYKCKPVDKLTATMFLIKYNALFNDNVELVYAQKLSYKGA